jgi:hypothetical protein
VRRRRLTPAAWLKAHQWVAVWTCLWLLATILWVLLELVRHAS